jgi:APA family basic amino acid/polyamine antiporter
MSVDPGMKVEDGLPRQLSLADAIGILVGSVIGSAIFKVTADMTRLVQTPSMVLAVWVAGGVISFAGGVTFAELGTRYPTAGGLYVYLRETWGALAAFLFGWALLLVIQTGSIAAVAVAFADYAAKVAPTLDGHNTMVAVALIVGLSLVNAASTRMGATVQNVSSLIKCSAILGLIALSLASGKMNATNFHSSVPSSSTSFVFAIGAALVSAMWAYDGWYQVGTMAGELKDPDRDVPRALFIGLSIVCVLYILVSIVYLSLMPASQVSQSKAIAADAARTIMGIRGEWWISLAVSISTFGCVNGMTISAPRVYYAMSRDGMLPRFLGEPHPRFHTPFWAILIQGAWSVVLVLAGNYEELYNYVMFAGWFFYGLAGVGLVIERRRRPKDGTYRAWGYPWTTGLFVAASVFCLASSVYEQPKPSLGGMVILTIGAVVYTKWMKVREK